MDMKLEVVVVPVSDVDRAKDFYQALGWRLDADFVTAPDFRVIQMTPPALACDGNNHRRQPANRGGIAMNQGRSATRAQSGANGCAVPCPGPAAS
jgi:catechol 2,3-dioxygenase-like lactoylglutathione lyase family enzyme